MDFSQALIQMKAGKKVTRPEWDRDCLWLCKKTKLFTVASIDFIDGPCGDYGPDGDVLSDDLLADDWKVVSAKRNIEKVT